MWKSVARQIFDDSKVILFWQDNEKSLKVCFPDGDISTETLIFCRPEIKNNYSFCDILSKNLIEYLYFFNLNVKQITIFQWLSFSIDWSDDGNTLKTNTKSHNFKKSKSLKVLTQTSALVI